MITRAFVSIAHTFDMDCRLWIDLFGPLNRLPLSCLNSTRPVCIGTQYLVSVGMPFNEEFILFSHQITSFQNKGYTAKIARTAKSCDNFRVLN